MSPDSEDRRGYSCDAPPKPPCGCLVLDPCGCYADPCACFVTDQRGCFVDCACRIPHPPSPA